MADEELPPIDLADQGRLISGSKSGYFSRHPQNVLAFNGGIYIKSKGHVWSGDMDVTRDAPRLQEIAAMFGEELYILRERDFKPLRKVKDIPWDKAIAIVTENLVKFTGAT